MLHDLSFALLLALSFFLGLLSLTNVCQETGAEAKGVAGLYATTAVVWAYVIVFWVF